MYFFSFPYSRCEFRRLPDARESIFPFNRIRDASPPFAIFRHRPNIYTKINSALSGAATGKLTKGGNVMPEQLIGKVTHYFSKLGVAVIRLAEPLGKGERVHIFGHTTDMEQKVDSMEINHQKVEIARPGDNVAIRVGEKVRENDEVFVVLEEELTAA